VERVRGDTRPCVHACSARIIVQEQLLEFKGRPFPFVKGPAINHFQQVESQGAIFWVPLLLAIGIAESWRVAVGWNDPNSSNFYSLRDDYEPGNLGFDPLGLLPDNESDAYDMKTKELNNGRLAMIAVAAFVAQELRSGEPIFAHAGTQQIASTSKVLSGKI